VITRRFAVIACLAAASGLAAGRGPRPAPPPSPAAAAAEPEPLRPLTSRDAAAPAADSAPTLPPGHPPVQSGPETAAGGEPVEGEVRIHARLKDRAKPDDVLYIIARGSASRQIVAVRKEEHVQFPFRFRLSSADTMMPGTPFAGPFDLTARLSRSGDATPQGGDLEGSVKNVAAGSRGVRVIVDTVRP
jgi:cytochrome c-type biogenesis protein CcmH